MCHINMGFMMPKRPFNLALVFVIALFFASTAMACPNCREALTNGSATPQAPADRPLPTDPPALADSQTIYAGNMAEGFAYAIYIMLAVPYLLLAAGGYGLYRVTRPRASATETGTSTQTVQ